MQITVDVSQARSSFSAIYIRRILQCSTATIAHRAFTLEPRIGFHFAVKVEVVSRGFLIWPWWPFIPEPSTRNRAPKWRIERGLIGLPPVFALYYIVVLVSFYIFLSFLFSPSFFLMLIFKVSF